MLFADASVSFLSHLFNIIIVGLGLLLMLTILIQRGKGGGLVGAFGGAGGSSAFGSKAGDAFTRITLIMAGAWIFLIMLHVNFAKADLRRNTEAPQSSTFVEQK